MEKKGLSPVITTVLLVLLAIVLSAIIWLWAKNFITETPLKFDPALNEERPISELCAKVVLQTSVLGDDLIVNNLGSIPVTKLQLKTSDSFSSNNLEYEVNLLSGDSKTITSTVSLLDKKIEVIPILLGKMKDGTVNPYLCGDNSFIVS